MADKVQTTVKSVDVEHSGTKIILPVINGKPMSFEEGIVWLDRMRQDAQTEVAVHHEILCSPLDGAVAFQRAMAEVYGWSRNVATPGFWGSRPPVFVSVPTGPHESMQVAWGRVQIPGIEGFLTTGMATEPSPRFVIGGTVKKKCMHDVQAILAKTEELVRTRSIYKGKAIRISFAWEREEEEYDPNHHCPKFMDLDGHREDELIFGRDVQTALDVGLFGPIENAELCRRYQVPLKRGVLLYGPYGTGKTLTANVTALKAVRNGFTFVYLDHCSDLRKGLEFAAQYAPAVVFTEDIDRAVTGARSSDMDEILNTLDGVDTKGKEIITVLTSNHVDQINPALLRPGRLDTLIEVLPPDADAAVRLVKLYARGLLENDADFEAVGRALKGRIPAVIREVVERSKIAAITRLAASAKAEGRDPSTVSLTGHVLAQDVLAASVAMENHARMLEPKEAKAQPNVRTLLELDPNAAGTKEVLKLASQIATVAETR